MNLIGFSQASAIVDRFLDLLDKLKITPPLHSDIESELLSVTELLDIARNPCANAARPSLLAKAGGIFDLAVKLLSIESQAEFNTFIPHLQLFASKLPLASVIQTTSGNSTDDVHRKLVELYLGSLAVHVGSNVELDHPSVSRGDNPDVLFDCTRQDNQITKRWALAIKTISSKHGQTIFERISGGSKQINAACRAERGIVVINTQGALDHEALWSQPFLCLEDAQQALLKQVHDLAQAASTRRPESEWTDVLSGKTSPVVLFMGHAVVRVATQVHHETPTVLKILLRHNPTLESDDEAESIAWHLNDYMQRITKGVPGSNGRHPE